MNDLAHKHVFSKGAEPQAQLVDQIEQLMRMIVEFLPVTSAQYPSLDTNGHEPIANFCVRHSALHFSKTAGQLAAIAEALDHGVNLQEANVRKIAVNSVINSFKLASEVGLSPTELVHEINLKFGQ